MLLDDDQVLIRQILEGDKSSFEELMKKYNRKMFNFILRMVREEEIAIELTQDLLLRMGPYLVDRPNGVFFAKWESEIVKLQGVADSIARSDSESARDKAAEVESLITSLKEVLTCLPKVKL